MKNGSIPRGQDQGTLKEKIMVSLGKYFGERWNEKFATKEEIYRILQALSISNEEITDILQAPSSSQDRCSILATIRNLENRGIKKIIVDIITGVPTWEQFIDVTYDTGANRDIRIIVFDGEFSDKRIFAPGASLDDASNLVARNNRCGVATYLVEARCTMSGGLKGGCEYILGERPSTVGRSDTEKLPTKRQVQEAEFWIAYYTPNMDSEPFDVDWDIIERWWPEYELNCGLRTRATWTDEGFLMHAVASDSTLLKEILKKKQAELKREYPGCEIGLRCGDDGSYALSVKIDPTPMTDLIKMKPENKVNYGEKVLNEERRFGEIIDRLCFELWESEETGRE